MLGKGGNMNLKTLCVTLFLTLTYALAQDSWENYMPRTLNQIIQQHAPELAKTRGQEKAFLLISADPFQSRVFEAASQQPGAAPKSGGASSPDIDADKTVAIAKLIKEGLAREDAGDLKGAIEINQKILQRDPENIYAMNTIAGLFGKL